MSWWTPPRSCWASCSTWQCNRTGSRRTRTMWLSSHRKSISSSWTRCTRSSKKRWPFWAMSPKMLWLLKPPSARIKRHLAPVSLNYWNSSMWASRSISIRKSAFFRSRASTLYWTIWLSTPSTISCKVGWRRYSTASSRAAIKSSRQWYFGNEDFRAMQFDRVHHRQHAEPEIHYQSVFYKLKANSKSLSTTGTSVSWLSSPTASSSAPKRTSTSRPSWVIS